MTHPLEVLSLEMSRPHIADLQRLLFEARVGKHQLRCGLDITFSKGPEMTPSSERHRPDFAEVRKRSVDSLQLLYTVVVSLAVTEMLQHVLLTPSGISIPGLSAIGLAQWLMMASFLFTIVPFYHGATRYLDATYITGERKAPRAALLIDFVLLFIEGVLFFVLAEFIHNQQAFYTTLAILLALDVIWVLSSAKLWSIPIAGSAAATVASNTRYTLWAIINLVAVIVICVSARSNLWPDTMVQSITLAGCAVVRTIIDYTLVFGFYYPPEYSETSTRTS